MAVRCSLVVLQKLTVLLFGNSVAVRCSPVVLQKLTVLLVGYSMAVRCSLVEELQEVMDQLVSAVKQLVRMYCQTYHTDFFLGSSVDIPYSKCTCTSKHATGLREHCTVQNSDKTAGVHVLPDVPPRLPPGLLCGRSIKCTCTSKHVTGHSIQ